MLGEPYVPTPGCRYPAGYYTERIMAELKQEATWAGISRAHQARTHQAPIPHHCHGCHRVRLTGPEPTCQRCRTRRGSLVA